MLQYARPDALEFNALAPWINFPRRQATVLGNAVFDTRDETSSAPASMPLLVVLSVVGVVAMIRPPPVENGPTLAALRIPFIGSLVGVVPTLTIAFIANRYLGDLVPVLLLGGLTGINVIGRWWGSGAIAARSAVAAGLVVLGLWGVTANLALAIEYQRLIAPVDLRTRVAFVSWQYTLHKGRHGIEPFLHGPPGPRGTLQVADGRCRWSDGFSWYVLAAPPHSAAAATVTATGRELCATLLERVGS